LALFFWSLQRDVEPNGQAQLAVEDSPAGRGFESVLLVHLTECLTDSLTSCPGNVAIPVAIPQRVGRAS